jgi:rod shape-determining protein MreC
VRFFYKKAVILMVAVLTVFLLASSAAKGKYRFDLSERFVTTVLAPIESITTKVGYGFRQFGLSTGQLFTAYSDNQELRAENADLRRSNVSTTEILAENARLRAMLNYKNTAPQFDFVTAAIVARDPGTWTNIVVINRGSNQGIAKDMPVVTPGGLVGNVVEVFGDTAKVQLLLDPRSAVGALVQRPESRVAAIVEGNGENPLAPHMVNLSQDADVIKGDRIITSGFGGIYPKGLVIGEVV